MAFKDHEPIRPNYRRNPSEESLVEVRQAPSFQEDRPGEFADELENFAEWVGGTVVGTSNHESLWAVLVEDEKGATQCIAQGWWVGISSDNEFSLEPKLEDVVVENSLTKIEAPRIAEGDVRELSIKDLAELIVLLQVPSSIGRLGAAVDPLARIRQQLGLFGYPGTEEVAAALRNTEMR